MNKIGFLRESNSGPLDPTENHATRPKTLNKYALFCSHIMLLSLPFDSKELYPF